MSDIPAITLKPKDPVAAPMPKDLSPLLVPLVTGLVACVVLLYACSWAGDRLPSRNGAFWPAVGAVAWALFAAAANLAFIKAQLRVMSARERLYFAGLSGAGAAIAIVAGVAVMATAQALLFTFTDPSLRPAENPLPAFLLKGLLALVIVVPASTALGWLAVTAPLQNWFFSGLGSSLRQKR